jgi:calcineurin-like phosphoesterase family protein
MNNVYIITDTHFNHDKMVTYCTRPDNFAEKIWSNLLKLKPESVLVHLGDICIGGDHEVHEKIKSLPMKKVLVKGNHDHKSYNFYITHGWNFVCDSFVWRYCGKNILFTHRPAVLGDYYDINIHGHIHNNVHRDEEYVKNEKQISVSIENNHYQPILLSTLLHKYGAS